MELGELLASSSRSLLPLSPGPRPRRPPLAPACHHLPRLFVAPLFPRLPLRVGPAVATRANGAAAEPPCSRWRILCAVEAGGGAAEEIGGASPSLDGGVVGGVREGVEGPGVPARELREDSLSIWGQMKEIAAFAGPATGLWVCSPLMSLIDTMVIGQGSSLELAALAFIGPENAHMLPAASTYVQVIAAYMMVRTLNKTGFSASTASFPSLKELLQIFEIAAPVFITMTSKVAFYSLLTYVATSMGTITVAAHQVMINVYCMCTVWGEPLSQTAQSFMPELIHGVNRSLAKARMLLHSLVIIGVLTGLILGTTGTFVPWLLPYIFTSDNMVIGEMHKVLLPYFIALSVTPSTHSLEGTLMAGRDLKFLSLSMLACFCFGSLLLFTFGKGFGLHGCWWALSAFQWGANELTQVE
ncbi:hypothetical protein Taro_031406 [Colocasia esculenta]|uniref:Protein DETOXIFICATION n=1 Tax=Colocasia esculenta TaxID=4460 RepID=A0A843VIS9_COLES|nr:hypothetical protein [Colocasia esculenta]